MTRVHWFCGELHATSNRAEIETKQVFSTLFSGKVSAVIKSFTDPVSLWQRCTSYKKYYAKFYPTLFSMWSNMRTLRELAKRDSAVVKLWPVQGEGCSKGKDQSKEKIKFFLNTFFETNSCSRK